MGKVNSNFAGSVLITGVSACGKSSVADAAAAILSVKRISFGSEMLRIANLTGGARTRDEISQLSSDVQRRLRIDVASELRGARALVDAHLTLRVNKVLICALDNQVLSMIRPQLIVLLEAPVAHIIRRRKDSTDRHRVSESPLDIGMSETLNRSAIVAASYHLGCQFAVIPNCDGAFESCVSSVVEITRDFFGGPD